MPNKENVEDIAETLERLANVHYPPGPVLQRTERFKALNCMKTNELEAIYHLVESHAPSLRAKTVLRLEKILNSVSDNIQLSSKSYVGLNCTHAKLDENINTMLHRIQEMPSEWTIIQLTPRFNPKENVEIDSNKYYTSPLHISVFNCGSNQPKPFCIDVEAPKDSVNGSLIELVNEMQSITAANRNTLVASKGNVRFKDVPEKQTYFINRQSVDNRLKMLIKDLQELYLREWRCLMVGKYINKELELKIHRAVKEFFKKEAPSLSSDEKTQNIVYYLIKGTSYLNLRDIRRAIQSVTQDKKLQKSLAHFIRNLYDELSLHEEKRHPVILVVDDSLDCFPWEMMDVLIDVSVSRLPSLHLAYALFKEHKDTIKDGFKIIQKPENGNFVVNPDLDLWNMHNRITSFFEYWTPSWKGLSGCRPTEEQFEEMLVSADIFSYNGHGSGAHFFSSRKIERIRVNAVVLLFGCGSTKLTKVGPQTEMWGTYQMYLIACSPCIIGMLWEVTDLDTDFLTTELLSTWVPAADKTHWKCLDKSKWNRGEKVDFTEGQINTDASHVHEPELLKALSLAKKSHLLNFYSTRAACVARGIPVKIEI